MSQGGLKNPSPEEKLLRIIRSKGDTLASITPTASERGASEQSQVTSSLTKKSVFSKEKALHLIPSGWLEALNVFLVVMVCVGIVSILVMISKPLSQVSTEARPMQPPASSSVSAQIQSGNAEEYDVPLLSSAASRKLFQSQARSLDAIARTGSGISQGFEGLDSRLNLLGVVAGEKSQAIIEDSKTNKTYFLSVGQALPDGLVVEEILKDRVRLGFNGEKIELSL